MGKRIPLPIALAIIAVGAAIIIGSAMFVSSVLDIGGKREAELYAENLKKEEAVAAKEIQIAKEKYAAESRLIDANISKHQQHLNEQIERLTAANNTLLKKEENSSIAQSMLYDLERKYADPQAKKALDDAEIRRLETRVRALIAAGFLKKADEEYDRLNALRDKIRSEAEAGD